MANKLKVTLVKCTIGCKKVQIETVKAFGLRKLHQCVEKPDNPQIRGMIFNVSHLVAVEEA